MKVSNQYAYFVFMMVNISREEYHASIAEHFVVLSNKDKQLNILVNFIQWYPNKLDIEVDQKSIQEFAPQIMASYKKFECKGPDGMDCKVNFLLR